MIVVSSTSDILRKEIIAKAGPQVQAEYDAIKSTSRHTHETSNGTLPCKSILFLPCKIDPSDPTSLKPSLSTFVSTAIIHASKKGYKTLG